MNKNSSCHNLGVGVQESQLQQPVFLYGGKGLYEPLSELCLICTHIQIHTQKHAHTEPTKYIHNCSHKYIRSGHLELDNLSVGSSPTIIVLSQHPLIVCFSSVSIGACDISTINFEKSSGASIVQVLARQPYQLFRECGPFNIQIFTP